MSSPSSPYHRIAAWLYDWRWATMLACVALALAAAYPASQIGVDNSIQRWFVEGDPALEAYQEFQRTYGNDEVALVALQRPAGMLTPRGFQLLREAADRARAIDGIADVRSLTTMDRVQMGFTGPQLVPLVPRGSLSTHQAEALRSRILADSTTYDRFVSDDGTMAAFYAQLRPNDVIDGERERIYGALRDTLRPLDARVHLAGTGVIVSALNEASTSDVFVFVVASNVLIFLLLCVFFRRVGPVLLTLGVVAVATLWLLGLYGLLGRSINVVTLVMPTLVLVICTADCVHLLVHAADQPDGLSRRTRTIRTVRFLLRPCTVTTLTTALGFAALTTSTMPIVRDFGLFAAVGLVGGLVASIVGCTWGLAYAAVEPSRPADSYLTGVVDRLVRSGLQHPAPVLLGTGLVAAGAVVGIARLEADTNSIRHLFKDHPVRQDSRLIEKTLGPYAPLDFVVAPPDSASVLRPAVFSEVADWTRQARRTGEVGWSRSPVDAVQRLHTALSARSDALPQSTRRLQGLVRLGRGHLPALDELAAHPTQMRVTFGVPVQSADSMAQTIAAVQGAAAGALPGDYRVEATGYLPLYVRIMTLVVESQVRSFGLALLIILGVIGLLFRSVRAALLSIIPNVLPVLLTLGLMGWVGIPLDVATVTISAIVLGLVVDDTVHILHRYLHERQAGRPGPAAMLHGAHRGGRMLTITTTVLGGGFLVLCLAQIKSVVWFGLLSSTAIGLALLTDLLVLPAIVSALHSTSASTAASDPSPVAQEA